MPACAGQRLRSKGGEQWQLSGWFSAIPRRDIEAMDCWAVERHFDVTRLTPVELKAMFGRVTYRLDGYDAHPVELFIIADVRRFARQWHESRRTLGFFRCHRQR